MPRSPLRPLRRRTWTLRHRWHRAVRPLRRPARVLMVAGMLGVIGVGMYAHTQRTARGMIGGRLVLDGDSSVVFDLEPRGDAAAAGLASGDRLVRLGGRPVTAARADSIAKGHSSYGRVGDTLRVRVERDGEVRDVNLVYGRQSERDARRFGMSAAGARRAMNVTWFFGLVAFAAAGLVLFVRSRARGYYASLAVALLAVAGGGAFVGMTNASDFGMGMWIVPFAFAGVAIFLSAIPAIVSALVRFPDGRVGSRWTRHARSLAVVGFVAFFASIALSEEVSKAFLVAAGLILTGLIAFPVVALVQKYRRTEDTVVRQQMKWVLLPLTVFAVLLLLPLVEEVAPVLDASEAATGYLFEVVVTVLLGVAFAAVPIGVLAGVFRFRPWDADLWIARSAAVGLATLGLAAAFAGGAEAIRLGLRASLGGGADAIAAALAAVASLVVFNPVREWLTKRAERDLERTREILGERLPLVLAGRQVVASPGEIGRVTIRVVQDALRTERAAVIDLDPEGWEVVAAAGVEAEAALAWADATLRAEAMPPCSEQVWEDPTFVLRVPLRSTEDELVGVLALGTHGNGRGYSTEERRALDGVSRALAEALRVAERREEARDREYARLARLVEHVTSAASGDGASGDPVGA